MVMTMTMVTQWLPLSYVVFHLPVSNINGQTTERKTSLNAGLRQITVVVLKWWFLDLQHQHHLGTH